MVRRGFVVSAVALPLAIGSVALGSTAAKANPGVGIAAVCPLTGPGVAACVAGGTVLHEGVQALNGKEAFGRNGEGAKAARKVRDWVGDRTGLRKLFR
jgi:hypothetical protein